METLVLDPTEVSFRRASFDITAYVSQAGPDFGEAAIEQYLADAQLGQLPVDFRLPNRTITIPLLLRDDPEHSFEELREHFQQKTGMFQREGGWIKRQTAKGPLYGEVMSAQLKFGGSTAQALWDIDADAVLTLTTLPDWYGDEVSALVETNVSDSTDLIFTLAGSTDSAGFNASMLGSTPSLYWRLGASGLTDQSANARNGSAQGGLVVGNIAGALSGDSDAATDFGDAGDKWITATYSPFVGGTTRTFAGLAWTDFDLTYFLFGSTATSSWVGLYIADTRNVVFTVDADANKVIWPNAWPGPNRWVHWALVFVDGANTVELYINGRSMGRKDITQTYSSPGTLKVASRGNFNAGLFNGKMDEFAIWEYELQPFQISEFADQTVGSDKFAAGKVAGDLPARSRLVLKNLSTFDLHGLLWGVRSRNYSNDATAQLAYDAEALTPIAPAAIAANANASNGSEVKIASLSNNWTAILSTDLAGVGSLTHVGTYRVWARVRTEVDPLYKESPPRVRFVWDVGDLIQPVENPAVRLSLDADFFMADLGEIRIDRAPIGNHRWQGMIQAQEGYKPFAIDRVWFQPLDEAAGRLSISPVATVGLTGYSARDPFDSDLATAVTGSALPVGGSWTFSNGDTDDFTWDGANFRIKRGSVSDTAARFLYASGPTLTATAAQVDFFIPGASVGTVQQAFLMFRRVDASNYGYVAVGHHEDGQGTRERIHIGAVIGNTPVTLGMAYVPQFTNQWWSLRIAVSPIGYIFAWVFPQGSALPPDPTVLRYDPTRFATGKALASGKVGIGDFNSGTGGVRYYNNFLAWTPDDDAVIFAGKSAELRFDGMYREAPAGSIYAPMSTVIGDLLRVPPSGLESRTTEIFLKPSFGDLDKASDSQLLRLQAQMLYRPSYLFVPED